MKKIKFNLNDLACSFIGTVLLMAICFEKEEQTDEEKARLFFAYQKVSKHSQKYFASLEDTWNIDKILEVFEIKRTLGWQVCLVSSDMGTILCPYIEQETENEKGEKVTKTIPLSPRPDGFPTYTLRHAKRVHKIKW